MYISRVELNIHRNNTRSALASPQKLHASVEASFPSGNEPKERTLWRIDRLGDKYYLLALSRRKPDFAHIIDQYGWPAAEQGWETKDYDALLSKIKAGQCWQFRLRANPVHSVKEGEASRGKVYAHVTVKQQEKWLLDRAEKYGFSLNEGSFFVKQKEVKKFKRQGKTVTLGIVTYEGILNVTDRELFVNALTNGIGRAKAYGCGLLTIARCKNV